MKQKFLYSPHHQSNSFSRFNSKQDLCIDSSYISKYLGQQKHLPSPQKFMSTLYSNRFETNTLNSPLSDRSHTQNQYKQLTKNYFQNKYLLLTAGNEKSIKAWRNYLINSFRKKIEDFFNIKKLILSPQNRGRKLKLGRLNNSIKQYCFLSDEIIALNALAKQKIPGIDLIQEQDKLIKTNYQYLKNSDNVDYDSKMQSMIQEYEVIIDRIQREAFKIHLPNYIQIKMQNYNDFYDVDSNLANPYFSSKLYQSCQQLKFQNKKLVKNSQQISICENYQSCNYDEPYQIDNKIQIQKNTSNLSKPQVLEQNLQSSDFIKKDYILYNDNEDEILQSNQNCKSKSDRNKCVKHKYRIKKPHEFQYNTQDNLSDHRFVDYMLSLEDVYDCNLDQFKVNSQIEFEQFNYLNLDEYEFVDTNEEKKNQVLKPLIQGIIDDIKKHKSQQNLPIQEIIKILVRLPESKTNQTSGIALNIILKLFNTPILQEADLHPLLHSLYLFKDEIIENVQLKLVQCSVHLIHKEIVNINNPECIEKLICIFFTLVISKNPIIQTTSMTGLMKILDFLYAQYSEKPHRNGVLIFLQLIQGMKGQKVPFVVQHQYSKGICRDMIFQIIQNLGPFLNKDEQLSKLIEEISAIIYEEMSLDSAEVQFNARRIRDSFRMIVSLQRDISLLKHISLLFTRSPSYGYVRYWILEGILTLLQDPKLVMLLYQGPLQEEQHQQQQQQQSTFLQHLVFIIKLSTEQEPQYTINQSNQQQTYAKQKKLYEQNILNLTEIPIYNKVQFNQKSIECISHFTDSILQIAYEKQIGLFSLNYKLSQSKILIEDNCKEVNQIIETTQQLTLKTIQNLMINLNDEIQYQSILNSIQTWINLSGSLGQNKTRDAFIKFLSSLCVAKQNTTLTKNQLQSAKTLFNIAQLGNLLDIKSWYIIMKAMQQFEALLQKSQTQNAIQQESHPEIYQQEISLLNNILDGLFSSSNVYEDANLLHMIEAINQVTLSLMEQFNNVQTLVDSKSIQFGLQKIHQITKQNWFRINKFWDFITAHFLCIANYKHKAFRESALEIFSYIVQQGFIYFLKPDQSICWEGDSWQSHLLSPIQQMINIPYADVKETLLNIIFKLIQNNGHELNILGFNTIIEILLISCDETEPTGYVNIGFHILELLIGQFMHLLDPKTTRRLLPLIKQFRQRTTEQNISYVSVGLIWQLADNLSKICTNQTSQTEVEELWTVVLQSLKDLSLDNAPDVRQSALHIIIQIILINCGSFRINFQIDLLKNLIFKILDDLIGRVAQLQQLQVIFHMKVPKYLKEEDYPKFTKFSDQDLQTSIKTQNEVIVAWEDTLKIMIQNLTKFLKKIGQQEDQEFKQHAQQLYNETFIRLIISFKINNLDLRWEIIRLIKENTEIMIEKNLVEQLDWAKEFIFCIQEFIGQKIQDNRDVKTLINKILPEVCELYVLFLKAHNKNQNSFPDELIEDLYESYQAIVDLPINIENISNIKIWMDEKQLHDFAEDFYIHLSNQKDKSKFCAFLLLNMKKEGGMTKLQDLVILKYTQLLSKYISDKQLTDPELIKQYIDICLLQLSIRQNQQKVNNVKNYNKTNKPLWVQVLPLIIETIQICQKEEYVSLLSEQLNFTQQWDKIISIDGLKSCIDVELQICEWLLSQDILDREIINYWELLSRNINLYQLEDLFYETRQKLMNIVFKKPKNLMTLNQICQSLVTQFMKDEYMSGSMPLSRKRVQEIIQLLLELQSLKDLNLEPHPLLQVFECLVELITTREIDIKQPLQNLFKSVALKIRSHK